MTKTQSRAAAAAFTVILATCFVACSLCPTKAPEPTKTTTTTKTLGKAER